MYSLLLNNYTLPDNVSDPGFGDTSSNMHEYEAAVVYDKTELVITNLRHFQEYSIEVIIIIIPIIMIAVIIVTIVVIKTLRQQACEIGRP